MTLRHRPNFLTASHGRAYFLSDLVIEMSEHPHSGLSQPTIQ